MILHNLHELRFGQYQLNKGDCLTHDSCFVEKWGKNRSNIFELGTNNTMKSHASLPPYMGDNPTYAPSATQGKNGI